MRARRRGEDKEKIRCSGEFRGACYRSICESGERPTGGRHGYGEGFDEVNIELVGGVTNVGSPPWEGGCFRGVA